MESGTAVDLYARALALAGPEDEWGSRESRLLAGMGEARYWLGEFDEAEEALTRALEVGAEDDWTVTLASRFLGDIELNIRGEPERAEALFDRALDAARRLDDPFPVARTLLMAGWAPFWREDLDSARALFEEALAIARANPEGDRWAEARALTSLASVISPWGDEAECLVLAEEALSLGRSMRDPFTTAVALAYIGNSLRRMWRLDEAAPALEEAVRIFRDLGARWELASAIGDRATVHRLSDRLPEAEADLREAVKLCRSLGDRSLLEWSASELARTRLEGKDVAGARSVLEDPALAWVRDEPSMLVVESLVDLADGDRERSLRLMLRLLELSREEGQANGLAARIWWIGTIFGPEHVGGEEAVAEARRTLEDHHWLQALREPERWAELQPAR
jgi:tetratricopeptide (TPR) repeat protein